MIAGLLYGLEKKPPHWELLKSTDYAGIVTMAIGLAELSYASRQVETETFKTFQAFGFATLLYVASIALIEVLGQLIARSKWYRQGVV